MVRRLKIGINGFGRIGRAILRINHQLDLFDVVVINDINPDLANLAYLLRYDSVHGAFPGGVGVGAGKMIVGGKTIAVHHHAHIRGVPWQDHAVDVLIDASGSRENLAAAADGSAMAGHYLYTHAVRGEANIKTLVFGVNEDEFEPLRDTLISASICDTIALGPLVKLIEQRYGIACGFLTTLHPWLSDQHLLDGPANASRAPDGMDSHYALGRAAINNLIPKSTTAVVAADLMFPGLSQKLESFSYRVPTNIVSSAVLNLTLRDTAEQAELIEMFYRFEREQKWKIITNSTEPKVSLDYGGCEFSVAIDQRWTMVKNGRNLRLVYWYDNEWGYSSRVVDLVRLIAIA